MSTPESPTHIFISQFRSSCGKLWALERFETPPTTYPYLWNVRLRTRQSRGVGAGSNFQGHEDAERAMKPFEREFQQMLVLASPKLCSDTNDCLSRRRGGVGEHY